MQKCVRIIYDDEQVPGAISAIWYLNLLSIILTEESDYEVDAERNSPQMVTVSIKKRLDTAPV